MARKQQRDDDLLLEDELTAAFLGSDDPAAAASDDTKSNDWLEEENLPGQLAVDVYETPEKLIVQAPIAGIDKNDLEVSISDNTLSVQGSRKSGAEHQNANYYVQECYWGQFARSITLPVPVKEDEVDAVLKDGVLTITFTKLEQNTVKKIEIK
jgi:HSP20 family protein